MKQFLTALTALVVAACAVFSFTAWSFATEYDAWPKAYNIYSDPVTKGSSGRFTSFMIDFYSDDTPDYTFWALANFGLFKSSKTVKKYRSITGGGGYAGLQDGARSENPDGSILRDEHGNAIYGKIGIMSFWEMTYFDENNEKQIMTASALYPHGDSAFGGEGEGSHVMWPYAWDDGAWYTMLLHTWNDAETGTTFMGQWFRNVATGEWTLHSYFDTHLIDSCMNGGMGLFMENWSYSSREEVRTFRTKNIYIQDYKNGEWKSLDTCTMSYGDGGKTKVGGHDFGATDEYFWGVAGGTVEDQAAYDAASKTKEKYTITQPADPALGEQKAPLVRFETKDGKAVLTWKNDPTGAPQLSYEVRILDRNGETVASKAETRPEVCTVTFEGIEAEDLDYALTVSDVFGRSAVYTSETARAQQEEILRGLPFPAAELPFALAAKAETIAFLFPENKN